MDKYKNKPVIFKKTTPAVNDDESNQNAEWESELDSAIEENDNLETQLHNSPQKLHRIEDANASRGFHKSIEAEIRIDIAQAFTGEDYFD